MALSLPCLALAQQAEPPPAEPTPAPSEPFDPEARWVLAAQQDLPALAARALAAEARADAAERCFAGELEPAQAFLSLQGVPLGSRAWLTGRLAVLDGAVADRQALRAVPLPPVGEERVLAWTRAREAALLAEDRADALERRALLSLRALAEAHPLLRELSLSVERTTLQAGLLSAERAFEAAEDDGARVQAGWAAAAAVLEQQRTLDLLDALRRRSLAPSTALPALEPDLAAATSSPSARRRLQLRQGPAPDPRMEPILAEAPPEPDAAERKREEEDTRKAAEGAREAAIDAEGEHAARILESLADAQASANQAEAAVEELVSTAQARLDALAVEAVALEDGSIELGARSALDAGRKHDAANLYRRAHELLTELRRAAITEGNELVAAQSGESDVLRGLDPLFRQLEEERRFVGGLPEGERKVELLAAVSSWNEAVGRQATAAHRRSESARERHERLLGSLREAKEIRRVLAAEAPDAVLREDTRTLFEDVRLELQLFRPNLVALSQSRITSIKELPRLLTSFDRLAAATGGILRVLLVLLLWWLLRGRVPRMVQPALDRLADLSDALFPADLVELRPPLERATSSALDLLAISVLLATTSDALPEIALLLVALRMVVAYRLGFSLFQVAVSRTDRPRPSLLRLMPDAHGLATFAARALLLWVLVGRLAGYLARDVLGADALAELLGLFFAGALVAMSVLLLHMGQPALRRALAKGREPGLVLRIAGSEGGSWLTRWLRGLWAVSVLVCVNAWQLLQGNVDEDSAIGRLANLITRRRLRQQQAALGHDLPPLTPAARWKMASRPPSEPGDEFTPLQEQAGEAFAAWQEDPARGLIAVVGDQGEGASRLARRVARSLAGEQLRVVQLQMTSRIDTEGQLTAWLAEGIDLDPDTTGDLTARMRAEPRSIFLVEDLQRAFLRRVGGFTAVGALLELMARTADIHFWVVAVHEPAWRYLGRLGTVVQPEAFRAVLEVPRTSAAQLGDQLMGLTGDAGFRADFAHLAARAPGSDEQDRAREAYFRLLAEASDGNPGVARELWLSSLSPKSDEQLDVFLPDQLADPAEPKLSDDELLCLAAIRVHGSLSLEELITVNNMEPRDASVTVQNLASRRLLEPCRTGYALPLDQLPTITRVLRRRHFVYGAG